MLILGLSYGLIQYDKDDKAIEKSSITTVSTITSSTTSQSKTSTNTQSTTSKTTTTTQTTTLQTTEPLIYKTETTRSEITTSNKTDNQTHFVLNSKTKKAHSPKCREIKKINVQNQEDFNGTSDQLKQQGYSPCKICCPW